MANPVVTVKITGAKELQDALKGLKNAPRKRVLERGLRAGAERILQSARSRTDSADIRKGLQVINVKAAREGEMTLEVGLPGGRHDWFHGLYVELGTGPRVQGVTGRFTGSMPARPFLRPAFDEQQEEAQQAFFDVVKIAIEDVPKRGRLNG